MELLPTTQKEKDKLIYILNYKIANAPCETDRLRLKEELRKIEETQF